MPTHPPPSVLFRPRACLLALADLVSPRSCPGCREPGERLCVRCREELVPVPRRVRPRGLEPLLPAVAGLEYAGVPARVLIAWKERGRLDLTGALAPALSAGIAELVGPGGEWPGREWPGRGSGDGRPAAVVPVPSSPAARRRRGAAVVEVLAGRALRGLPRGEGLGAAPQLVPALRLVRTVADQAGLGASARSANLAGAFALRPGRARRVAGRRCLVVDDVITTGATITEAARALAAAGAEVIGAAAVGATPLRSLLPNRPHLD